MTKNLKEPQKDPSKKIAAWGCSITAAIIIILFIICQQSNNKTDKPYIPKKQHPSRSDRQALRELSIYSIRDIAVEKKIGSLSKGQYVKIDSLQNIWCNVYDTSGNFLGYSIEILLHPYPIIGDIITFNRAKRYVHKKANIRSGRGTNHRVVDSFIRGSKVIVDSLKDDWYATFDDNDNLLGYVHKSLIKDEPLPNLEIVDWNWYTSSGYVIYNVQVRNNTASYIKMVKVEFTSYDKSGNLIDTDFTFVTGLQPGGTASSKGYATKFGNEHKANIKIVQ